VDSYYGDGGALIQDPINSLVYYSGGTVVSGSYSVMCVSKSTDGGSTWPYRYNLTAEAGCCYALTVEPTNSNVVYAGGNGGLFKSTDAGTSWTSSSVGISGIVYDIKVNPLNVNLVYAGSTDGVFKSTNAGLGWTDTGCDSVNVLLVNPVHPDTVYAGTGYGVYLSTNAGGTWTAMNAGLANLKVKALARNPGVYLFCGTSAAAYRWSLAVGVEEGAVSVAPILDLRVYPNPCRGMTMLSIGIRAEGLGLKIYDATGRLVNSFALRNTPYAIRWNGIDQNGQSVPDGVYFVTVTADSVSETKTLLLIR
jgi:hypothetical protein